MKAAVLGVLAGLYLLVLATRPYIDEPAAAHAFIRMARDDTNTDSAVHRNEFNEIVARIGWPSTDDIGEEGVWAMWLIVLRAYDDPSFRIEAAKQFLEHPGPVPLSNIAYVLDQTLADSGQPQIFGTAFTCEHQRFEFRTPLADADGADARRARVGLPSFRDSFENDREMWRGLCRQNEVQ